MTQTCYFRGPNLLIICSCAKFICSCSKFICSHKRRDFFGGCREKERFICIIQKKVVTLQAQRFSNGVLAHLARARHWQCRGERFESAILHKYKREASRKNILTISITIISRSRKSLEN